MSGASIPPKIPARSSPDRLSNSPMTVFGGIVEIVDGTSLAEELGNHADAEILSRLLAGMLFEERDHRLLDRPRENRAPDGDDIVIRFPLQNIPDVLRDPLHIFQVDAAVGSTGGADAHQGKLRFPDRALRVVRGGQSASPDDFLEDFLQSFLDDGRMAAVHHVDFRPARVDADHMVPHPGEAGTRYGTDVPQAHDCDPHVRSSVVGFSGGGGNDISSS